jgi:hypothetical protein
MPHSFVRKVCDSYLLHPQAETFGPFDLAFVRDTLAKGGIAPTTGLTIVRDGVENRYRCVGDLFSEPRQWAIACTECQLSRAVTVTEAITIYGGDDYRSEHLSAFALRCPKRRSIAECAGQFEEAYSLGRGRVR